MNTVGDVLNGIVRAYRHDIVDTGRESQFIVLATFVVTVCTARIVVHVIRRGGPVGNVSVRGLHIHHLVPGILLLLVTGYLALALDVRSDRRLVAALFGVGAGLTLDEFALWLTLEDVYWTPWGRRSVYAVLIAGGVAGLIMLGGHFWVHAYQAVAGAL